MVGDVRDFTVCVTCQKVFVQIAMRELTDCNTGRFPRCDLPGKLIEATLRPRCVAARQRSLNLNVESFSYQSTFCLHMEVLRSGGEKFWTKAKQGKKYVYININIKGFVQNHKN